MQSIHETLGQHQLADGYSIVLDLERSHGVWLVDAVSGKEYLDVFTCFASWPVGFRHPALEEESFSQELLRAARMKPANSDLYTAEMAAFVDAFANRVTPDGYPHHFWVSGGALAVENALKVAFDWKARKLGRTSFDESVEDLVILHFAQAFHGRSGYTLSLTNTVPDKVGLFPKFDWPRVHNPAIQFGPDGSIANDVEAEEARACAEIDAAFEQHGNRIAGIVIEPMQGEGGDNHFRTEFMQRLRDYADEREALLIFDEVQTGFFGSGKPWLWQHHGVAPDVVAFGKKTQVCGIYASRRVEEVQDHVFSRSSRINSTWGGNLVDMVRCRRFIKIVEEGNLCDAICARGEQVIRGLRGIASECAAVTNVRGLGSLLAFSMPDGAARDAALARMFDAGVLALACGPDSIRFRLPFVISEEETDELLSRVGACIEIPAASTPG